MTSYLQEMTLSDWGSIASILSLLIWLGTWLYRRNKQLLVEQAEINRIYQDFTRRLFQSSKTQLRRSDAFIYAYTVLEEGRRLEDTVRRRLNNDFMSLILTIILLYSVRIFFALAVIKGELSGFTVPGFQYVYYLGSAGFLVSCMFAASVLSLNSRAYRISQMKGHFLAGIREGVEHLFPEDLRAAQ